MPPGIARVREKYILAGVENRDINEEQVNFLLEQGFNVNEMSNMLGVGKRTLERRMQSFGLSVTGKLCIFYG